MARAWNWRTGGWCRISSGQALRRAPLTVYGDGRQTRSFCYVDDLVDGILRLLNSGEHDPTNIGNPNEISILQFAEFINRLTDNPAGIKFVKEGRTVDDPQQRRPDITKARVLLGWEPKVTLEDGLGRTIEYFSRLV
jgi:dTDP-glucose 4,6-dehydratase